MSEKLLLVAGVFIVVVTLLLWYAYNRTQKLNREIEENNKLVDKFNEVGIGEAIDFLNENLGVEIEKPKKFKKQGFEDLNKAIGLLKILIVLWFVWWLLLELQQYLLRHGF